MSIATATPSAVTSGGASKKRRLITTDSHIGVPFQVADELPEKYRKHVPHLEKRADGTYLMRPDIVSMMNLTDADSGDAGASSVLREKVKRMAAGVKVEPDDEASMARLAFGEMQRYGALSFYPKGRLVDMEQDGVVAEVLIGSSAFGFFGGNDPDGSVAWCRLNNDWYADTYKDYIGQFAPGISLPIRAGIPASVKELERAAGRGLRPLLLPEIMPDKPWFLKEWEPIWEVCASLNVPVNLHISGNQQTPWATIKRDENIAGSLNAWVGMAGRTAEFVGMFVNSGVLERHPGLNVVFNEMHAGWLAWAMQAYDHYALYPRLREHTKFFGYPVTALKELPSYYIKRQIKCSFMWDPVAIKNRHETGLDSLMWGNDYPHMESTWPNSQALVEQQFAGVPEAEITRLVHDNAASLYRFTV